MIRAVVAGTTEANPRSIPASTAATPPARISLSFHMLRAEL